MTLPCKVRLERLQRQTLGATRLDSWAIYEEGVLAPSFRCDSAHHEATHCGVGTRERTLCISLKVTRPAGILTLEVYVLRHHRERGAAKANTYHSELESCRVKTNHLSGLWHVQVRRQLVSSSNSSSAPIPRHFMLSS